MTARGYSSGLQGKHCLRSGGCSQSVSSIVAASPVWAMGTILVAYLHGDTHHILATEQLYTGVLDRWHCTENSTPKLLELHSCQYKTTPPLHHSKLDGVMIHLES